MASPLDPVWAWYQLTLDCMRVTQRAASDPNLSAAFLSKHTSLFHLDAGEKQATVEVAKEVLDRLTVLDLATVFERTLRTHTTNSLPVMIADHAPFLQSLRDRVESRAKRWTFDELVELYGNVHGTVRGLVKDVIKFRDWAAHGWHTTAKPAPSNITPKDAYQRPTDFLTAAGIAT
ncbi:MAG TPA: hypothetical protein VGE74_17995 [Gemmata sp.]